MGEWLGAEGAVAFYRLEETFLPFGPAVGEGAGEQKSRHEKKMSQGQDDGNDS